MNAPVDVDTVLATDPDHLVIATGAVPYAPAVPGDGSVPVLCADGPVALPFDERTGASARNVVIVDEDGYYWTSAVAESVMAQGKRPIVVTRFFEVGRELPMVSRIALIRQLDKHDAQLWPNAEIAGASGNEVLVRQAMTGRESRITNACAIVWVGAARSNGALARDLAIAGFPKTRTTVVGDAFSPRRLVNALVEAHTAARQIGSRPA